ncbi:hypothetical protein AN641_02385 [Candidatus Epulonipiscioides gigas]|nr:hypothetical protein AN641_02385 [Epulopiscium sp. SCG-C07WGA-EpuloA2]
MRNIKIITMIALIYIIYLNALQDDMVDTDRLTLDWYINYSWFKTNWGDDIVSKTISDKVGVDIEFITPIGHERDKFSSMLKTNSLPDIITLDWSSPYINEMLQKDMVYALNELDELYNAGFQETSNIDSYNWYTQSDGNIYGYPNASYTPEHYQNYDNLSSNQVFMVRKDIYEALGSPDMSTKDGFKQAVYDATRLFSTEDNPLIPIGSTTFNEYGALSFDTYLQNFLAIPYEKNGLYYDRNTDVEYIEWLKVFNELFQEGYLLAEIFTDQRIQLEEKFANGEYFCILYQRTDITNQQQSLYLNKPDKIYMAVDGPKNSNGDNHILPGVGINGWTLTFISKNCNNPQKALELITYMMSDEGQLLTAWGVEGETFDYVDEKPVFKEEVIELLQTDRELFDKIYGSDYTYWMFQNYISKYEYKSPKIEPLAQLEEWTYPYTEYTGQYEITFSDNVAMTNLNHKIQSLWGEYLIKLLISESEQEFNQLLNEYIHNREQLGYYDLIQEINKRMAISKKKLGMK